MRRSYTIECDNREKVPLLFPDHISLLDDATPPTMRVSRTARIFTVKRRLPTADYILQDAPHAAIVERKKNLVEIATNVLDRKRRPLFVEQLLRMQEWPRRLLFIEGDPVSLFKPHHHLPDPHCAMDALQRLLMEHRVELLLFPANTVPRRRQLGEYIARWLINASLAPTPPEASNGSPAS